MPCNHASTSPMHPPPHPFPPPLQSASPLPPPFPHSLRLNYLRYLHLLAQVKGHIPLDGATLQPHATSDHPHCLLISTPARRLSLLTPGLSPGPFGSAPDVSSACAKKMSFGQKMDVWGKHALRQALAGGSLLAPVLTSVIAADDADTLDAWFEALKPHTASAALVPTEEALKLEAADPATTMLNSPEAAM